MERFARVFPFLATMVIGAAHAMAWRAQTAQGTWLTLAIAWGALTVIALYLIRREEMHTELFTLVPMVAWFVGSHVS